MAECSVDGCARISVGLGYCQPHYFRVRRTGSPGAAKIWDRKRPQCSAPDCAEPHYGRGYCLKHMRRVDKGGHPDHIGEHPRGAANPAWRGDQAGYTSAHQRVYRAKGPARAQTCSCGQPARQWSYTFEDPNELVMPSGLRYSGDPKYYVARCVPCHKRSDLARLKLDRAAKLPASGDVTGLA